MEISNLDNIIYYQILKLKNKKLIFLRVVHTFIVDSVKEIIKNKKDPP